MFKISKHLIEILVSRHHHHTVPVFLEVHAQIECHLPNASKLEIEDINQLLGETLGVCHCHHEVTNIDCDIFIN